MVFLKMNSMDTIVMFFMIPIMIALWKEVLLILWMKGGMMKEMVKKSKNEVKMKTEEIFLTFRQKVGVLGEVWNVSLWMMLGCSL